MGARRPPARRARGAFDGRPRLLGVYRRPPARPPRGGAGRDCRPRPALPPPHLQLDQRGDDPPPRAGRRPGPPAGGAVGRQLGRLWPRAGLDRRPRRVWGALSAARPALGGAPLPPSLSRRPRLTAGRAGAAAARGRVPDGDGGGAAGGARRPRRRARRHPVGHVAGRARGAARRGRRRWRR
ncbi:hypothetical protein BU14_0779s0007 [Porphyra umbilicalis]|uniref:Uncharacterized protein n=1 Tax=Porphyra umbilicalis TaxID=2786 RepID=A0A1X6NPS8_PORUM|nr:hypothetical protein BU14_0779s0007 [Porphyra umbilicalis]|eukprot:OSX70363.1 hypothetical protein BU14_0779s0007 [Porphyra umbilicalis]